ncbi:MULTISPECIES: RidA family protein [Rhodospirillales]|uniref:Endoribonuclease L-PSP, putative n=2 Tax=Rhodospirillales TaxID=204441 RepID=B6ITL6_RHOCS|nr:RidA family protein [Rhodospirillum centenum]ACI99317.1 endoribonuclease L-PSP, putative [Rhodospirillum centenum SW]
MAGRIDARLAELGIELPQAAAPVAAYVPAVRTGNLLFLSGQITLENGELRHKGKLGDGIDLETGRQAARLCGLNILAQAKAALGGDLDRVVRVVKLVGFVNSTPDFVDQPKVVNGASELMQEVFGEAGRHARSAVSAGSLPLGVAVEVEAILEVAD